MPIRYFPELSATAPKWGAITGNLEAQSDLAEHLESKTPISHLDDDENPHSVNKSQVGLSELTNDAQLKRSSADFVSFDEKAIPGSEDILLIEDSDDDYGKKKIKISSISGSSPAGIWENVEGDYLSTSSFTFDGSENDAPLFTGSFFACTDENEQIRKKGYIKSAEYDSGEITANVVSDVAIEAGDKDFVIARGIKADAYFREVTIPGELIADSSNSQGAFHIIKEASYFLATDAYLRTAASGGGASAAWNVYKNSTALFTSAQDFGTDSSMPDRIPDTREISGGDIVSVRISASGGTSKPADIKLYLLIVPQTLFTLI